MKHSIRTGFAFGLTSAIITTLGLMVGLESGTKSKLVVAGGIITIAIADAFSDALGIHVSEESKNGQSQDVWEATLVTFLTKFFFALTFIIPLVFFALPLAVIINIIWGIAVLGALSFVVARSRGEKPFYIIFEHIVIAVIVIIVTYYVGRWVALQFG